MVRDVQDEQLRMLRAIAQGLGELEPESTVNLEGSNIQKRLGLVPAGTVVIKESGDLDGANSDGSITISPGETETLAVFDRSAHAVYAVGAKDVSNVVYWLEIDDDTAVGPTNGPLGTVNSPFSFVENYGGAIPAERRAELKARNPQSAPGDVDVVGRMHLEVM